MPWLQTEPDFGNEQVLLPSSGYSRAVGGAERPHVPVRVGHAGHSFPFPPNAKGKPPTRTGCRRRGTGNRPEGVAGPFRQHVVRRTDPALDKWTSTQPWVVRQRKGPCVNRRESVSFPPVQPTTASGRDSHIRVRSEERRVGKECRAWWSRE